MKALVETPGAAGARTFLSAASSERSTVLIMFGGAFHSDTAADRNVRAPAEVRGQRFEFRWLFLFLLLLAVLGAAGCASTESENMSARPWNSPKSWENGLPSSMTEGR